MVKKSPTKLLTIFFLVALIIFCCLNKEGYLTVPIVSVPNTNICFSTDHEVLEQTWQPNIKKISGIEIPYTSLSDFDAEILIRMYTDDLNEILAESTVKQQFIKEQNGGLSFTFEPINVKIGERIRIQMQYISVENNGEILLDANYQYAGCSIDGEEENVAVAMNITAIRNTKLFWMFSLLFPLVSFSFLGMTLWKRKWEDVIGTALIVTVAILYFCGIADMLKNGIALIYILSIIAFFAACVLFLYKDIEVKELVSPGLVAWFIFFILIIINCNGLWLARSDEYTHWGLAVKDMFYYDSLAKHLETTVITVRYMPFSTLMEYFAVYLNGIFSVKIIYVGFQLTLLSLLAIVFQLAQKNWRYMLPAIAICVCVPVIFFFDVSNCLYVDPLLAVLAAYVLICYYGEKASVFNWIRIISGLFALVITKDIGVAIAGLICCVMLADGIFRKYLYEKRIKKEDIILPVLCVALVLGAFMSWQMYLSVPIEQEVAVEESYEIEDSKEQKQYANTISASHVSISGLTNIILGEGEEYQYKSIRTFAEKFLDGNTYEFGNIEVSCMDIFIIIGLTIYVCGCLGWWKEDKACIYSFGFFSFIAGIGYAIFLEILYLSAFPRSEAVTLASHERYLGSIMCPIVIAFLYLLLSCILDEREGKGNKNGWLIAVCISMSLFVVAPISDFIVRNKDTSITSIERFGYDEIEEAMRSFGDKGEKIYFVCSNGGGASLKMLQNSVCPMLVPMVRENIAAYESSVIMQEEMNAKKGIEFYAKTLIEVNEWKKILDEYQYVFILNADEAFKIDYKDLFAEPETVAGGTIYKVMSEDGELCLNYVGQIGFYAQLR